MDERVDAISTILTASQEFMRKQQVGCNSCSGLFLQSLQFLVDHTVACSMIGFCDDTVVCLSVCL